VTITADTLSVKGSLIATAGAGAATITLSGGTVGGGLTAVSGNTSDNESAISVTGIDVRRVATLITGAGIDTVDFIDSSADLLTIDLCAGNDELFITGTTVVRNTFFNGGANFDSITGENDETNDFQGPYTRILFENVADEMEEPEGD
jgi:hypothetical protein